MMKKKYTLEELEALKAWFDDHASTMPDSMQIDNCTYTPQLSKTVSMLFDQAFACYQNEKMQGCIHVIERIKQNLENKGI